MEIDDLSLWRAFLSVAEQGGFSKAAQRLRVPVPQISKRVARLESRLGIRLFLRSTRVVRLTNEGKALFPKVASIVRDLDEVTTSFEKYQNLSGVVRVTCVPYVARKLLVPHLKEFRETHPNIRLDLQLTKNFVNLIESDRDIAIRIDSPTDNDLIYRKLAPNRLVICASPRYLDKNKEPIRKWVDLKRHDLLFLKIHENCRFTRSGAILKNLSERKLIESDSGDLLVDLALQSQGILVRAYWDVKEHLEAGRLVAVLKGDPLEIYGHIYAVILSRRYLSPRVRAFFDFFVRKSELWQ